MATLVYRYGTRNHWDAPPEIVEQMRLANHLRNRLVETERDHDAAMASMWSEHPEVAEAEKTIADLDAELTVAIGTAKTQHQQDRTRTTRTTTSATITALRKQLREAKRARRDAIANVYAIAKPQIEAIRAKRAADQKATYAEYGQTSGLGLYWGTDLHIRGHHKTAVQRIASDRKKGKPAELKYHRFDGSGTISAQVMHNAGDPIRSPQLLASGKHKWLNVFRLPEIAAIDPAEHAKLSRAEQRRVGRTTVTITLGGGREPRLVEIPVQIHRPLPPDADICYWELTRRRIAGKFEHALCITVRVPDPEPAPDGSMVALHLGWRIRSDRSVRVAAVVSTRPLDVPATLADVVHRHDDGHRFEITMPARIVDISGRPASVRAIRDDNLNRILPQVADWLERHPTLWDGDGTPYPRISPQSVRMWRSAGRLAATVHRWRQDPEVAGLDGGAELVAELEAWRLQDRHLWEWEANERQQTARHRDDLYRQVGAWLASAASAVAVDDADMVQLRRRMDVAEADPALPGIAEDRANARAVIVAPGRLRELVVGAAVRRGRPVVKVEAAGLSRVHADCGFDNPTDPRFAASATVECCGCGDVYDQDWNAAGVVLTRALHRPDPDA